MAPIEVVLYTKTNCSICVMAKAILDILSEEIPLSIREFDIYQDDALLEKYQLKIPVIEIDGSEVESGLIHKEVIRKRLIQKMGIQIVE
jgi:glutaredoxin